MGSAVQTPEVTTSLQNCCTNKFHTSDKMTETKTHQMVCKFYNTGYCKNKGACKFLHPIERCERSCKKSSCPKRHPKPCRYGDKCRRKEICDYKHKTASTENDLKADIKALKVTIKVLQDESKVTKIKIAKLEFELLLVKQKGGTKAENVEANVKVPEEKVSEIAKTRVEEEVTLEDIIRENSYKYQCDQKMDNGDRCDFTTRNKKDLKTHRKKYFECDICLFRTRTIHNDTTLEDHMKEEHDLPEICTTFQCSFCTDSGPFSILIEQ